MRLEGITGNVKLNFLSLLLCSDSVLVFTSAVYYGLWYFMSFVKCWQELKKPTNFVILCPRAYHNK